MQNENKFTVGISVTCLVVDVICLVTISNTLGYIKGIRNDDFWQQSTEILRSSDEVVQKPAVLDWQYYGNEPDGYVSPIYFTIGENSYNLGCSVEDITGTSDWYVLATDDYGGDESADTTLNGKSITLLCSDYPTCLLELLTLNDKVCAVTYVNDDSDLPADVTMCGVDVGTQFRDVQLLKKTSNFEYKYTEEGMPYDKTHYCEFSADINDVPIALISGYISDSVDNMVIIDPNLYPKEYIQWVMDSYKETLESMDEVQESEVITELPTEPVTELPTYDFELPESVSTETFETIIGEADFTAGSEQ